MAPGHTPAGYYMNPRSPVHESVDAARAMVAAGRGDSRRDFSDINQGRPLTVRLTAKQYLSFWDPESDAEMRSEEHTSELQSLMRISYAVFCLKKKKRKHQ